MSAADISQIFQPSLRCAPATSESRTCAHVMLNTVTNPRGVQICLSVTDTSTFQPNISTLQSLPFKAHVLSPVQRLSPAPPPPNPNTAHANNNRLSRPGFQQRCARSWRRRRRARLRFLLFVARRVMLSNSVRLTIFMYNKCVNGRILGCIVYSSIYSIPGWKYQKYIISNEVELTVISHYYTIVSNEDSIKYLILI